MQTITIDGLFNARADPHDAPWLIRSGAPDRITPDGAAALRALGATVVIDLREPSEQGPHDHGIPVLSVPIYGSEPPASGRIEDVYEAMLRDRGEALARAVGEIAGAEGAALVHCAAGKDRTGLVVALALSAAGAPAAEIIDDYARSGAAVRIARAAHAQRIADSLTSEEERAEVLRLHLESPPEAIARALAVLDELGGAATYLQRHGMTDDRLVALAAKHGGAR